VTDISCRCVLLDIEGTVAPVAFVTDVMFPFARAHVPAFLKTTWNEPRTREAVGAIARDMGYAGYDDWFSPAHADDPVSRQQTIIETVFELMDKDAKMTGLKLLQGLVWRSGFESGELVAKLFKDVVPALHRWKESGLKLAIYSSGSVEAQRLFFGHTSEGNLLGLFSGFFDTTSGNKKSSDSYRTIAATLGAGPEQICFISDIAEELDAAHDAGMITLLRGDCPLARSPHKRIDDFSTVRFQENGSIANER
jgi:enolase-phosphatase E1